MRTLRFFCLFMLVACCFGSPITVHNSGQGAAWFTGYVDTVPSGGGFDYLLGWSFEVRIDYRLSGWDGVTPFSIYTGFGQNMCHSGPFFPPDANTNCIVDWSGPVNPDILGFSIADGQLTGITDLNGSQAVIWDSATPDRWSGYWLSEDGSIRGDISGPG